MGGICGIVYLDYERSVEGDVLRMMCRMLRHRGPDDEGIMIAGNVGIGSRRLSIIDVMGGRQPIPNEDGRIWVASDGEIYNFPGIRSGLERSGHRFKTRADIEVIVHLYEERGVDCLEEMNGVFAFCVYDSRDGSLFLARDRMGSKPLYYFLTEKIFLFASEVKAFLVHPDFQKRLDVRSFGKYLAFGYVPVDHCIFEGVSKLLPGYYLIFKGGKLRIHRYWDIEFLGSTFRGDENEAEERLREVLKESVRRRLIGDVSPGVFLSGGIDSSSVTSFIVDFMPAEQLRTFSIGFTDPAFDESGHARRVARWFGTTHHEDIFDTGKMLELLPEVVDFLDEPFADSSVFPTYMLSKFTKKHVRVALGGDGGDELFAGYPMFQAHKLAGVYEHVPRLLRQVMLLVAERLPVSFNDLSLNFQAKRFMKGVELAPVERHQVWLGAFAPDEVWSLLQRNVRDSVGDFDLYEDIRRMIHSKEFRDVYDLVTYLYLKFYLVDDILAKVDRASMAVSLEVRAPFLDKDVVEFAAALPTKFRLRGFTTKYLLKKAMKDFLPCGTAGRRKKGFGVPVAKWMAGQLRGVLEEHLSPERLKRQGLFNEKGVERLMRDHFERRRDNHKPLWTLLMFQLWYDRYMGT